ncbi:inositol monophosphatase family protein [Capillimicrobium parvum]|uniref:Inositol-1-monophosphatase n=1 Tax=Capillimicrobium parvum TaxID=2884022 RepID=A0A9E7C1V3_9ACTN|nr:inositol monophosphatase family protein [Capillimicrobium parvum]UGS36808.1 Inositol-1-monophosphatase [Capillimicrobium parvum]
MARAAALAAGAVALRHHGGPLEIEVKSAIPTDVVTAADREAEAAAVAAISAARPADAVFGEEGTDRAGEGDRRWVIDAIDGTLNYSHGIPGWCSAVVLTDGAGPLACAVFDPERAELFGAARGHGAWCGDRRLEVRGPAPLDRTTVAVQWGYGKLALPGVRGVVDRIVDGVGALRVPGSGTLELTWVAAGRLHGWMQPDAADWDWLPGALLVREADGAAITVDDGAPTRWSLAGHPDCVADLRSLLRSA